VPEGDTLFRAARTLHAALAGRTVTRFASVFPALTRVDEDAPLAGRTVEKVDAAGKHLLMHFSDALVLRTHMRMSGSWHLYRPGEPWRRPARDQRIRVETDAFVAVAFNVPVAEFLQGRALARQRDLRALGPDLLGATFDADEAVARLRALNAAVEVALLDQRAVAGIGNIYKSETLFAARVHPLTPVAVLSDDQLRRILEHARKLMHANVRLGSPAMIVTHPGLRTTSGQADAAEALWVYGRAGRPCRRCGTPIVRAKTGPHVRSTYWCPRCQPLPA
jgi:endonuclease-8